MHAYRQRTHGSQNDGANFQWGSPGMSGKGFNIRFMEVFRERISSWSFIPRFNEGDQRAFRNWWTAVRNEHVKTEKPIGASMVYIRLPPECEQRLFL